MLEPESQPETQHNLSNDYQVYGHSNSFACQIPAIKSFYANLENDPHIPVETEKYLDFGDPTTPVNESTVIIQPIPEQFWIGDATATTAQMTMVNDLSKKSYSQGGSPRQASSVSDSVIDRRGYTLADNTNKKMIASNLMRIYHDSLENALSSWLSEKTCPYSIEIPGGENLAAADSILDEWGPSWTNRICTRVCWLDSAFSGLRKRPFTAAENSKASRVLNTAIMAFASQWSQTKPRRSSGCRLNLQDNAWIRDAASAANGFKRIQAREMGNQQSSVASFQWKLQRDLWYAAREALQDSAEMDSFKVIFAHMIFALIQRPLAEEELFRSSNRKEESPPVQNHEGNIARMAHSDRQELQASNTTNTKTITASAVLDKLIDLQGPPIYLEVALRHLFSWRTRIERHDQSKVHDRNLANHLGDGMPGDLHKKGFNLLFWLGVMCDTTSAAINQRPLVISDEDSGILKQDSEHIGAQDIVRSLWDLPKTCSNRSDLWGNYLLKDRRATCGSQIPRWPCAPEEAASILCEATPIKVLLYRKVALLQTLSYRRATAEELEDCIHNALAVYCEWNATYMQFMIDCVTHHDQLPSRIRSWHVILSCHWYLACLLLADEIETIDLDNRGLEAQKTHRENLDFIMDLRRQNASAIAAVADASSSSLKTYSRSEEFHSAMSDAALLSEPWTDILMRSFAKAACAFLQMIKRCQVATLSSYIGQHWEDADSELCYLKSNTIACIHGLEVLGRKSETAAIIADVLFEDLEEHFLPSLKSMVDDHNERQSDFIRDICDLVSVDDLITC